MVFDVSKIVITDVIVKDIRFPTSLTGDGSDAMHVSPDYSCPYVVLRTNEPALSGYGLTFTNGRGNDVCVAAVLAFKHLAVGQNLGDIVSNFGAYYRKIASDGQLRWLGPEKGIIHISAAALLNAVWDLWARALEKPLWKLLVDLPAEQLVKCIDFRYITDALTEEQAIEILKANKATVAEREEYLKKVGLPAYTTSVGWLGYSDEKVKKLCQDALAEGWTAFKMKVGDNIEDDKRRAAMIRKEIGNDKMLACDANQRWSVPEAIEYMSHLKEFNFKWIEEPTSPDDILGHATIAKAVYPIGVATGEHCQNRVIFKQLMQAKSITYCQIDSCRVGSVNENLAIILMAKRFNIPVVPHAGGVGLCEYVQHLAAWDYIAVSTTLEDRIVEYVDHLHEHFKFPCVIKGGRYMIPTNSAEGYSIEMKEQSLIDYEYPHGKEWKELIAKGIVKQN